MSGSSASKTLVVSPSKTTAPVSAQIVQVAKLHKVSPIKQLRESMALRFGANKLASNEYYAAQVYRPELSRAEKKQFIGERRNKTLNQSMSPRDVARISDFLQDKVLYISLLNQLGVASTKTQAVVSVNRGFGSLRTLRTQADIEGFLLDHAIYPLFGKPVEGSKSVGSALFKASDKSSKTITFGNGDTVDISAVAAEILVDYPRGYVFQDAVAQHASLSKLAGPALGTVRVVTVYRSDGPQVLYASWKIPSPEAMSDNFWQSGSMLADIDDKTGQVRRVRRGQGIDTEILETHPVSGLGFAGFQIPDWQKVLDLTLEAHRISPGNGLLGWDIGLSKNGPVIVECNTNPLHTLYQLATGEGLLNDRFAPVFEGIAKHKAAMLAAHKA
ncbi:MAG: hypothetical protein ACI932_000997 [Paracoccaceae bacterium]|jgi:hypothetical protein